MQKASLIPLVAAFLAVPASLAQVVPGMPMAPVSAPIEIQASSLDAADTAVPTDTIRAATELRDRALAAQDALPSAAVPGAVRPTPSALNLASGRNEMVQVARNQPNRFITPFDVPVVRFANDLTTVEVDGRQVYVTTGSNSPVTLYVEDDSNPENVFVLTLVPRDIPAASIKLSMVGMQANRNPTNQSQAEAHEQSDHFVAVLRDTFKELAQGRVPRGYGLSQTVDRFAAPDCLMPGLQVVPGQTVTGADFVVYVSRLTNSSRIPQSVDEQGCASDRVLAVAAWPFVELMPGQSTELYVAVRRHQAPAANARPSLIN